MNNIMKSVSMLVVTTLCATTIFAQTTLFTAKLKEEAVPEIVLQSVTEDFPDVEVTEYAAIPVTVIEDRIFVNTVNPESGEDYDTYVLTLSGKSGFFTATYDGDGNLISTSEKLKDIALPRPVDISISRHFPGWHVDKDKMVMTSVKNGRLKTHYKVKLMKGKETHHLVLDGNGNIVRGGEKAKKHRQIRTRRHHFKESYNDGVENDMDN